MPLQVIAVLLNYSLGSPNHPLGNPDHSLGSPNHPPCSEDIEELSPVCRIGGLFYCTVDVEGIPTVLEATSKDAIFAAVGIEAAASMVEDGPPGPSPGARQGMPSGTVVEYDMASKDLTITFDGVMSSTFGLNAKRHYAAPVLELPGDGSCRTIPERDVPAELCEFLKTTTQPPQVVLRICGSNPKWFPVSAKL